MSVRYNLYKIIQREHDIDIRDVANNIWSKFEFLNGYYTHVVTLDETQRSYLISEKWFSSVEFDDLILIINNIENPFTLRPKQVLKIPKEVDIRKFIKDNIKNIDR